MAGDDAQAKASVSAFIKSLGLRLQDTGDLSMAHGLEGAGLLSVGVGHYGEDGGGGGESVGVEHTVARWALVAQSDFVGAKTSITPLISRTWNFGSGGGATGN